MTTTNETTIETPKRKRSPNKPKTDFKLAEIASKKYSKLMAREQAAVEKAASKVRDRFQTKKDEFLDELTPNVKALFLASVHSQTEVVLSEPENPDVTDSDTEEETVTAVAV